MRAIPTKADYERAKLPRVTTIFVVSDYNTTEAVKGLLKYAKDNKIDLAPIIWI